MQSSPDVRSQVLTSIQNWAFVFKGKQEYSAIQEAYDELKSDGHTFPKFSENDAMFSVVCAPNWKEGSYCHRCKVAFTTFRRRVSRSFYYHNDRFLIYSPRRWLFKRSLIRTLLGVFQKYQFALLDDV